MDPDFGPLLPEGSWVTLAVLFVLPVAPVVVAVLTVIIGGAKYRRRQAEAQHALPAEPPAPIEARLAEIDGLLGAGRIDQAEHAAMRSRILDLR